MTQYVTKVIYIVSCCSAVLGFLLIGFLKLLLFYLLVGVVIVGIIGIVDWMTDRRSANLLKLYFLWPLVPFIVPVYDYVEVRP